MSGREKGLAFAEKYLAVRVRKDGLGIEIHNAHVPDAATVGAIKVHADGSYVWQARQGVAAYDPATLAHL